MHSTLLLSLLAILTLVVSGCTGSDPVPLKRDCEWEEATSRSLDLQKSSDKTHLRDDAAKAEDFAIRYADKTAGPRSGRFTGFEQYGRRRDKCMAAMFTQISERHGVSVDVVREYRLRRNTLADVAVIGSFALIYVVIGYFIAGPVIRRFPSNERIAALIAVVLISVPLSAAGVMLGELWSLYIEVQRVGMGHLSYRTDRIPWMKYREMLFACGLAVFWATAALRHARPRLGTHMKIRGDV